MDTGTHVVMGIAVGGLATLDPNISGNSALAQSVMIATIVGSQAPDFDTVLKLKGNAPYIRNHRGPTHSVPALFLWPTAITLALLAFNPSLPWLTIWGWSFFAVFFHVFVDIFNAYGTQALSPFRKKWIALGVINIFDAFIFFAHIVAIILWRFGSDPGYTFLTLYIVLTGYYIWRYKENRAVYNLLKQQHPDATHIFISPTFKWNLWHVVIRTKEYMYVTEVRHKQIKYFETYSFDPIPDHPIINAALYDDNLSAFLSFSPTYRWELFTEEHGYTVKFTDLRYRSKGHYPFVAIVQLDESYTPISSYTGWVYNKETLQRKLEQAAVQ
ncbi:metal-dependent hydrolase [Texcoconibacillus texcoconensis]|uniref:Inner membrane protein n=1 Tax=Texcoconibacillus texcoconensis TaxID=1095777 RepID=A0A840QTF6_9BACI|nr:metal-dependent hydrolase [Texcoconibacillus texcoconensis]MBB5174630.1 inner membrane protein [Texcoconibacillus texcoconensis]